MKSELASPPVVQLLETILVRIWERMQDVETSSHLNGACSNYSNATLHVRTSKSTERNMHIPWILAIVCSLSTTSVHEQAMIPCTLPGLKNTLDMPKRKSFLFIPTAWNSASQRVLGSRRASFSGRKALYLGRGGDLQSFTHANLPFPTIASVY